MLNRLKNAGLDVSDPIQQDLRPSYGYRWFTSHSQRLSAMGAGVYERLEKASAQRVAKIEP